MCKSGKSVDNESRLVDHYHYIDFLQNKAKWSFDTFKDGFPEFEAEIRKAHEAHALEIGTNAVGGLTPGVKISLTSRRPLDKMRPLPNHVCILALDTLIIDLKRIMIFSLSTVELAAGFKNNTSRSLETFFDQCEPEYEQLGNQRSKLAKLIVEDDRSSNFASFIQQNLAHLRKLNSQRASLEHIDLYYGAVHHLELKWPEVETNTVAPPSVDTVQFLRKGQSFLHQVAQEVQLAVDFRNHCGALAKVLESDREGL